MNKYHLLILIIILQACSDNAKVAGESEKTVDSPNNEIVYHLFQRSFYDSNGDAHGDLNGIKQKLDYLQELGVTSILLLPLYESIYYHNYFTGNYEKIDEEFGTEADYIALVKELHRRGMKVYMDMETQYATEDHPWYRDSYKNPSSPYSDYLLYNGPGNTEPETIIFDLKELKGFNDSVRKITTINLNNPKVKEYFFGLYKHWVDPNGDGNFDDGVDGFRLDHMMDDLDNKGKWTNLFDNFWRPLITKLKEVNPALKFVAEQANWASLGLDYLDKGGVDRVFAFRVGFEIRNFNKQKLEAMADSVFNYTPKNKGQFLFIENHDMPRFAHVVEKHPGKLRIGAVLNMLIGGIPTIYYGQEIGMYGAGGWMKWGMTDANEIPVREAFEWYKSDTGRGMAFWYKNSGPWWDSTNVKPNDGISLEEQKNDPASLWNFYREMIRLRKTNVAFVDGSYQTLTNNQDSVFSFLRYHNDQSAVVVVNMSGQPQNVAISLANSKAKVTADMKNLYGDLKPSVNGEQLTVGLKPYDIVVWSTK